MYRSLSRKKEESQIGKEHEGLGARDQCCRQGQGDNCGAGSGKHRWLSEGCRLVGGGCWGCVLRIMGRGGGATEHETSTISYFVVGVSSGEKVAEVIMGAICTFPCPFPHWIPCGKQTMNFANGDHFTIVHCNVIIASWAPSMQITIMEILWWLQLHRSEISRLEFKTEAFSRVNNSKLVSVTDWNLTLFNLNCMHWMHMTGGRSLITWSCPPFWCYRCSSLAYI